MHMPLRQQGRDDGFLNSIHIQRQQYAVGGSPGNGKLCVKLQVYRRTHNQGNPFGILETLPSDNLHQKACCEQRVVGPLSEVLSVPRLLGILGLPLCPHESIHVLGYTSNYNSLALVG